MATCDPITGRYPPGQQPLLDRYTGAHAAVGAVYGALGLSWKWALALGLAWEFAENPLKDWYPQIFPDACKDTIPNAAGDVAGLMVGWLAGARFRRRKR